MSQQTSDVDDQRDHSLPINILHANVDVPQHEQLRPDQSAQAELSQDSVYDEDLAARSEAARMEAKFPERIDTARNITLRFDFMSNKDTRIAMIAVFAATIAGFIVLIVQTADVFTKDGTTRRFQHNTTYIWNIAVGAICMTFITLILFACGRHAYSAYRRGKRWEYKRKRIVTLFAVEAAVQWINLAFYIIPNVYLLHRPCYFYDPVISWCAWVRWTCWNTVGSAGPTRFDVNAGSERTFAQNVAIPGCKAGQVFKCSTPEHSNIVSIAFIVALSAASMAVTCCLLFWKLRQHRQLPYQVVQTGTIFFRLQLRLRIVVMAFFVLCLAFWMVRFQSCASFMFSFLGIMPMQIVMTANAFVWNFICMVKQRPEDAAALRVWEQEVAWTEADKKVKLAAKALTAGSNDRLLKQPIFCFETMMHMLYWSSLVYDYKRAAAQKSSSRHCRRTAPAPDTVAAPAHQPERTILSLATAMATYQLVDSELIWELKLDTRCLMAWSNDTIVVAFRGTASMTNAWLDLQVWRVVHSAEQGRKFLMNQPLVHGGFMKSWLTGSFNEKVLSRVMEVISKRQPSQQPMKIYVTGHSLGRALATLAAYDIRKHLQEHGKGDVGVVCYSFGAPRTGNHAFAKEYNQAVPDTWSIINDQDVVTRGGKFLFLYKRPGRRVIVNNVGHMAVCPSSIEASVQQAPAGHSVDHHFLTSYTNAILSVILAQFSPRAVSDGMAGIIRLAEASPSLKALMENQMGMHLDDMKRFASEDPASRKSQTLPGAHLPVKGFYRIKSANASNRRQSAVSWKLRILSWLPFWSAVPQQPADLAQSDDGSTLDGSFARQSEDSGAASSVVEMPP